MKGALLGYAGIVAILVSGIIVLLQINQQSAFSTEVTTKEGALASFENFNHFFMKTFREGAEFISQRAAYDIGKLGGSSYPYGLWTETGPDMEKLEENLRERIMDNLPKDYAKGSRKVYIEKTNIRVEPSSNYFLLKGFVNFTIYDETIRTRTMISENINYKIPSNYFKLLSAARAMMEDEEFNQYLDRAYELVDRVYAAKASGDRRFADIEIEEPAIDGDTVEITVWEYCYPLGTYCLSPLNAGETGDLSGVPYDFNKLVFRYQKEQTASLPAVYNFGLKLSPNSGVKRFFCPGGECQASLSIVITGTGTCAVSADLTTSDCDSLDWQVKDGSGNVKCSGTLPSKACSGWQATTGPHVYSLYIDGVLKDTRSASCAAVSPPPTTCTDDNQCDDFNVCTIDKCEGSPKKCTYTPNAGVSCGKKTEACADKCENSYLFTTSKSCNRVCTSSGTCGDCVLPSTCTIDKCKNYCVYNCNSGKTDCASGYYCPTVTAKCQICDSLFGGKCGISPNGKSCTYPDTHDSCIGESEHNLNRQMPGRVLCEVSCTCNILFTLTNWARVVNDCRKCGDSREPNCGGADCSSLGYSSGCWLFKASDCYQSDTKCTKYLACSSYTG